MFGSLGGALSLYLGCAVVMLFELAELVIDVLLAACAGVKKDKVEDVEKNTNNIQKERRSISFYEAEFDKFVLVGH